MQLAAKGLVRPTNPQAVQGPGGAPPLTRPLVLFPPPCARASTKLHVRALSAATNATSQSNNNTVSSSAGAIAMLDEDILSQDELVASAACGTDGGLPLRWKGCFVPSSQPTLASTCK